ncbi:hypothetical protein IMZ48_07355, partial [Candidatus Bathyarchaeota archaeon]|nr:hypothetical protein [Candidatus Bathyarchaeota archaeon]
MVRAYVQTDIQKKIPSHIKRELDRCARWAAADGGYQHPHPLPNLLIEIVDPEVGGAGIIHYMQGRLKALAEKHRDFWRRKVEQPPVLYGLFIVNTTLLLLTVDAAKGPDADVSYQVECKFSKMNQGVWNAITVAIVVCRARDDLVARKKHFA